MIKHFIMAYRFMRGETFKTRLIFACFFMFKEAYRVAPLKHAIKDMVIVGDSQIAYMEQEA